MSLTPAIAELRNLGSLRALAGLVASPLLRYEAWLDSRASRRALYHMNELDLADIGLTHPDFAESPAVGRRRPRPES
jgi:uncharacterized protein YjiS (DUF1127 family)